MLHVLGVLQSGKGGKSGPPPTPTPPTPTTPVPSQQPSIPPSAQPSVSPAPSFKNFPSSRPSESAQPSPVPTQTPPPITQSPISEIFPGGTFPQCEDPDTDPCLCGTCLSDGTCDFSGQAGDGRPEYLCFQPNGYTCNKGDANAELTVSFSPDNGCSTQAPIPIDNEPSVCPDGWLFEKDPNEDCKQDFANNYFMSAPCVDGGAEVQVHASCSTKIELCYDYCGFLLAGYSILNQEPRTWYYPPGKS